MHKTQYDQNIYFIELNDQQLVFMNNIQKYKD